MLTLNNLNAWIDRPFEHEAGPQSTRLLTDVSLQIRHAQTVALVGESGSGKSLTALSILRLLEENTPIKLSGSIIFEDQELLSLPLAQVRKIRGNRIAMIFQEPMTSLNPVFTIGNQISESLKLHRNLSNEQIFQESVSLLQRSGIDDPESRMKSYPHELSGGQRQRVMIAMALACGPSLLIADEPTTALDVSIQAKILQLIEDIQHEYKMGMLLITHDLALVRNFADFIYIMKDGRVVEQGAPQKIFENPESGYTRKLIASIPIRAEKRESESEILLSTKQLTCSFRSRSSLIDRFTKKRKTVQAVDNVSLTIRRGTTCGIIGESGSGKTTLALALLKLVNSSGDIIFNNISLQEISRRDMKSLRDKMQIVFQDPYSSLSPRMTVGEIVAEGLIIHRTELSRADRDALVAQTLEEVGLDSSAAARYPHEFSGGQRQRVAIARVLILRPELLILDEPTSALDMTIQAQIIDLLNQLQQKYQLTYLFISHDLKVIRAIADYLIVMRNGRVVEYGPAQELFSNPANSYTDQLFKAAYLICPTVSS